MDYSSMTLVELKELAKKRGLKKVSSIKKADLIQRLKQADEETAESKKTVSEPEKEISKTKVRKETKKKPEEITEKSVEKENTEKPEQSRKKPVRTGTGKRTVKAKEKWKKEKETPVVPKHENNKTRNTPARPYYRSNHISDNPERVRENPYSNSNYNSNNNNVAANHTNYHTVNTTGANTAGNNINHGGSGNPGTSSMNHEPSRPIYNQEQMDSGKVADGILEVMPDGFGFIRCENYLPGEDDVYVSPATVRRFNLRTGDILHGSIRVKNTSAEKSEKFGALLRLQSVNGYPPEEAQRRIKFEELTPVFPNERIRLENENCNLIPMRIMDLLAPVGKGQRGMIVSPPKTGKTTLIKQIAKSVSRTYQDMFLIVLLIDERPEEVTDIRESIEGPNVEVIYSTFDELPEHHKRVSEMVLERAKRLVEHGKDVMILLDSITRLARAYNLTVPPSGRTLSGGLDPAALHMPKKFFGAARNMRDGGSLTILATALVETGSKMDDVVFEEFKGTGNMELVLDRHLSEKRIFPAIDVNRSGTRRDDLLLTEEEQRANHLMHRELSSGKNEEAVEEILKLFTKTRNNKEFVEFIMKTLGNKYKK